MAKTLEKVWAEIESRFDWETVHKTMKALEWEWRGGDFEKDPGVPNIRELKRFAKEHIKSVFDGKAGSYSMSGGLCAEKDSEGINLYFVITRADSSFEN